MTALVPPARSTANAPSPSLACSGEATTLDGEEFRSSSPSSWLARQRQRTEKLLGRLRLASEDAEIYADASMPLALHAASQFSISSPHKHLTAAAIADSER